jgi:hypothetical protein
LAGPRTREEIFRDYRKKVDPDEFPQAELGHIEDDLSEVDKTAPVYGSRPDSMDTTTTYAGEVPLHQGSFLGHNGNQKDIVWQWILFVNDNAEENEYWIEKTKGGADLAWGPTLKYPNGRIMSIAGDVELFDRHNPYPDTGLVRFRDVPQDNFWFGLSDIPPLIELQRLHDDMMENIRLVHRFMANSRLIIDKTTGLQPGEIGNDPDEIWWTQNATHDRVRIQEGIVPRAEFYGHLSFLEAKFDLLSGHTDALRGMNPPNVQAARHFGQLQRAAATRVRGRLRDMEDSLVEAGRMIARRVQQFYPSYTEARVNDDRFESLELSQEDREGDFDIEVSLIANLDEMRAAEFQQLLVLHKMGVVSDERLIEDSGLSSSQTLLAELPEVRQQRQMQMMAMAAQQNAEEQGGMDASDAAQSSSNTQRNVARATKGGRK